MINNWSTGGNFTTEELQTINECDKRETRHETFRWIAAGITVLTLGICWIKNRYGKSPVEIHTAQKPRNGKKDDGEKK